MIEFLSLFLKLIAGILFIVNYVCVLITLYNRDYDDRKEFLIDLIPFYYHIRHICYGIYTLIDRFRDLK